MTLKGGKALEQRKKKKAVAISNKKSLSGISRAIKPAPPERLRGLFYFFVSLIGQWGAVGLIWVMMNSLVTPVYAGSKTRFQV
jgi:hypothetical protein